jgi:four helix bundle protein
MRRDDPDSIDERSFAFFCDVLSFASTIPRGPLTDRLIDQLASSAGSITGNRDEALGGSSRREFVRYNEIAMRGANETVKWLRTCAARKFGDQSQCMRLLDEGRQIARILGKIVVTSKRNGLDVEPGSAPSLEPKPKT